MPAPHATCCRLFSIIYFLKKRSHSRTSPSHSQKNSSSQHPRADEREMTNKISTITAEKSQYQENTDILHYKSPTFSIFATPTSEITEHANHRKNITSSHRNKATSRDGGGPQASCMMHTAYLALKLDLQSILLFIPSQHLDPITTAFITPSTQRKQPKRRRRAKNDSQLVTKVAIFRTVPGIM